MANSQGPAHGPAGTPTQVIPAVPAAPPATAPRPRGTLTVVALVVAVLALVVGLAGAALAALALGRSDEATALARTAGEGSASDRTAGDRTAPTTATEPAAETPTTPATPDAADGGSTTASAPAISPSAQFSIVYEDQQLRIRSAGCSTSTETRVDLDEPRIIGEAVQNTELGYSLCLPGKVTIEMPFAQVTGPGASPADCLETIRTNPGRSPIAPTRGMTLCLVTSQNAAAAQGITQKLVFVTVDSITGESDDGVIGITAKAWTVPQ